MESKPNCCVDSRNKSPELDANQESRVVTPSFQILGSVEPRMVVPSCGCSPQVAAQPTPVEVYDAEASYIEDVLDTSVGKIPQVRTRLVGSDHLGTFKARWGINRMDYRVPPGLYAVGRPDKHSEVLVTANYKMSFDRLRRVLGDRNHWILVLDTQGINVWCAAGKGTFGTQELINQIASTRLSELVEHRRLILPQLGAVGVAAHQVKRASGFRVIYGPVMAEDLPQFLDAGRVATNEMRRKRFPIAERAALIPIELVTATKIVLLLTLAFFLLSGFRGDQPFLQSALIYGPETALLLVGALVAGTILTPLLLPWIPGRPFALKGFFMGLVLSLFYLLTQLSSFTGLAERLDLLAWLLIVPALSSFMAMNFTGASTYTSLSGVLKEMRIAIPVQIISAALGLVLWCTSLFV